MKFIKLRSQASTTDGAEYFVNTADISYFYADHPRRDHPWTAVVTKSLSSRDPAGIWFFEGTPGQLEIALR